MESVSAALINFDAPESWPADLLAYITTHYQLFLDWESGRTKGIASAYDSAISEVGDILQQYAITGWHCTRLTEAEIAVIISGGMQLPDATMLRQRIDALLNAGLLTADVAGRLKANNQAHEQYRAGMVWFCFFPPRLAGESGIARFFRFWGGEALYNSHERDLETGEVISRIGVPCLVEADVPIASLSPAGLSFKIVRRFLISRGFQTGEPVDHEDRIKRPLPRECVRRVIRYPESDFVQLTGCNSWDVLLGK